jgi:ATP-binding cassette subfamily C exporter for protease/lipase
LAKCLLGIWPEYSGDVLIGNREVKNLSRTLLGPKLGYLPQDVELMEGTVAENISRFYEADAEKIIEAAKLAGVHEMILRFPAGYDTQIGQLGHNLSGGQRQRIGLARALYGNPSLIVLDEPNANLDEIGERALIQAIVNLKALGSSIFIITHKLNILDVVDYMLVLGEGKLLQYGTRDEVLLAMQKMKRS